MTFFPYFASKFKITADIKADNYLILGRKTQQATASVNKLPANINVVIINVIKLRMGY